MMVASEMSVECFAKIAMTVLLSGADAMALLPKPEWVRRIFLGDSVAQVN